MPHPTKNFKKITPLRLIMIGSISPLTAETIESDTPELRKAKWTTFLVKNWIPSMWRIRSSRPILERQGDVNQSKFVVRMYRTTILQYDVDVRGYMNSNTHEHVVWSAKILFHVCVPLLVALTHISATPVLYKSVHLHCTSMRCLLYDNCFLEYYMYIVFTKWPNKQEVNREVAPGCKKWIIVRRCACTFSTGIIEPPGVGPVFARLLSTLGAIY